MFVYIIRRIVLVIPTFLGVTVLVFLITRFVPNNSAQYFTTNYQTGILPLNQESSNAVSIRIESKRLNDYFAFDKPWYTAYFFWLSKMLSGDLGRSLRYGDPVTEMILPRAKITLFFGFLAIGITYAISIPLGIQKALHHGSWFDNLSSIVFFILYALPSYIAAIILFSIFSARLGWFPLGGFQSSETIRNSMNIMQRLFDTLYHIFLPLSAYIINSIAVLSITMKNMLLENISADYVRTAIAKGRTFKEAVYYHAVKNSLVPIASEFGSIITAFVSGTFLIEQIFNIRGMGMLGYTALLDRDYPVVMGVLVVTVFISLFGNLLSDVLVSLLDPRIRFERKYA